MNYLSKTLPTYEYEHRNAAGDLMYVQRFHWNEIQWDEYDEYPMAEVRGDLVRVQSSDDIPASWWTVAVYTSYQVYGGPEEGGWHYAAGSLTEHGRVRFFDSFEAAQAYSEELWGWVEARNRSRTFDDERLTVRCTTNALPDTHYPKKRPYYS